MKLQNLSTASIASFAILNLAIVGCGDSDDTTADGGQASSSSAGSGLDSTSSTTSTGPDGGPETGTTAAQTDDSTADADSTTTTGGTTGDSVDASETEGMDASDSTGSPGSDGSTGDLALAAIDDAATTARGVAVRVDVLANDQTGDLEAQIRVLTDGEHGIAAVRADGTIEYRPGPGFDGEDSFQYEVVADGDTSSASVTVNVLPRTGTVSGGQLYQLFETTIPAELDPTEEEAAGGMVWYDINANGDRLGEIGTGCSGRSFILTAPGEVLPIQRPPEVPEDCPLSGTLGFNDQQLVVGWYHNAGYQSRSFSWTPDDGATAFLEPGALLHSVLDVDNSGLMVGIIEDYDTGGDWQAFQWQLGTPFSEIEYLTVSGYRHVVAHDINEQGTVIGHVTNEYDGITHPQQCFVIDADGDRVIDLPTGVSSMSCRGINEAGEIGGLLYPEDGGGARPFRIDPDGNVLTVVVPLEPTPGSTRAYDEILAVGEDGTLVGNTAENSADGGTFFRAFELRPVEGDPNTYFDETVR